MNTVNARPLPATPLEPALERLLARLALAPDFVAAGDAQRRLQGSLSSDKSHLRQVAALVQDDVALTSKFLRLINAVYFRPAGGGQITSLQRAVAVMGFDAAQRVCMSLKLLEQLPESPAALLLREDFLRALLASRLARELGGHGPQAEELGACAMFRNLGRMLVASHCPDDALAIRRSVPRAAPGLAQREGAEARRQLGASYASLGQHVARHWGWPHALVEAAGLEQPPADGIDDGRHRLWISWTANELADLLLYQDPEGWEGLLGAVTAPTRTGSPFSAAQARHALATARRDLERIAESVGLPLSQLRAWQQADVTGSATPPEPTLQALQVLSVQAAQMSELLLQPDAPQRVPQQALGSLFEALAPQRAVLLLRREDRLLHVANVVGKPLVGGGRGWTVDPTQGTDLFARSCQQGKDLVVSDAQRPQMRAHLPAAFACAGEPHNILLLPMRLQGRTLGMIYLDRADGAPFPVNADLMRLLRMVRNQTLAALR